MMKVPELAVALSESIVGFQKAGVDPNQDLGIWYPSWAPGFYYIISPFDIIGIWTFQASGTTRPYFFWRVQDVPPCVDPPP